MLTIETNINALYRALQQKDSTDYSSIKIPDDENINLGVLGELKFYQTKETETKLRFTFEGRRSKSYQTPMQEILKNLPSSYHVSLKSPDKIKISKNFLEYEIASDSPISIRLNAESLTREKYEEALNNLIELVQVCYISHYKSKNKKIPDLKYVLEPKTNAKVHSESHDHEGLDELEKKIEIKNPEVKFEDIGGCSRGKEEIRRIYDDIVRPQIAGFFGRDPDQQKGYLLLGDPGNGKTLLVKALATKLIEELNGSVKFYSVNYDDMTSTYRGGEALQTARIFELVQRNEEQGKKTLLFMDEIHVIGQRSTQYNEALDTLLAKLDGMKSFKGLTVIGATYMPIESLDPALIRQGRLSSWLTIEPPNSIERKEILQIYINRSVEKASEFGNSNLIGEIDLESISELCDGKNGSYIQGLVDYVQRQKETDTIKSAGENASEETIKAKFTPINTNDFRKAISEYREDKSKRRIGFRQELLVQANTQS